MARAFYRFTSDLLHSIWNSPHTPTGVILYVGRSPETRNFAPIDPLVNQVVGPAARWRTVPGIAPGRSVDELAPRELDLLGILSLADPVKLPHLAPFDLDRRPAANDIERGRLGDRRAGFPARAVRFRPVGDFRRCDGARDPIGLLRNSGGGSRRRLGLQRGLARDRPALACGGEAENQPHQDSARERG